MVNHFNLIKCLLFFEQLCILETSQCHHDQESTNINCYRIEFMALFCPRLFFLYCPQLFTNLKTKTNNPLVQPSVLFKSVCSTQTQVQAHFDLMAKLLPL